MNDCNFDHNGRCTSPDRMDDECDTSCTLYKAVKMPRNASHDKSRLNIWLNSKMRLETILAALALINAVLAACNIAPLLTLAVYWILVLAFAYRILKILFRKF